MSPLLSLLALSRRRCVGRQLCDVLVYMYKCIGCCVCMCEAFTNECCVCMCEAIAS